MPISVDADKALCLYQEIVKYAEAIGGNDLLSEIYNGVSQQINQYCKSDNDNLKSFVDECIKKRRALLSGTTDE